MTISQAVREIERLIAETDFNEKQPTHDDHMHVIEAKAYLIKALHKLVKK